jgi:hypothetical protein
MRIALGKGGVTVATPETGFRMVTSGGAMLTLEVCF